MFAHEAVDTQMPVQNKMSSHTETAEIRFPDLVEENLEKVRDQVVSWQRANESVGFVPTMGALHEGHLSLVDAACRVCDHTVVSIFVNPLQFDDPDDLNRYPRELGSDVKLLAERGCDLVLAPQLEAIYGPNHQTYVEVGRVAEPFEGLQRPGHFRGMATVVLKLLNIVPADDAFFGRKDYQQSLVVRQMAEDFNLPVRIRVCPTIRAEDGLAMSSRNSALSPAERTQAAVLWQSLQLAESLVAAGEVSSQTIEDRMRAKIAEAHDVQLEYVAIVRDGTMETLTEITDPAVAILAARVGSTRLIDNHKIA